MGNSQDIQNAGPNKTPCGLDTVCVQPVVQKMDGQHILQAFSTDTVLNQVLRIK